MVKAAPSQKTPLPTAAARGLPTAAQHSVGSRWRFCAFSRTLPGPGLPRHTPPRRRHGRLRLEARATKSTPVLTDRYPTTALNSGPHGTATGRLGSRKCVRPPWDPALQPRTQGPCVVPLRHPADAPAALLRKPQAEAGGWALLCGLDSDGSPSSADEGYQGLLPLLRAISAGPRAQATRGHDPSMSDGPRPLHARDLTSGHTHGPAPPPVSGTALNRAFLWSLPRWLVPRRPLCR